MSRRENVGCFGIFSLLAPCWFLHQPSVIRCFPVTYLNFCLQIEYCSLSLQERTAEAIGVSILDVKCFRPLIFISWMYVYFNILCINCWTVWENVLARFTEAPSGAHKMLHFNSMVFMSLILPLLLECVDSIVQFEKIFFIGEHLNTTYSFPLCTLMCICSLINRYLVE